jgi:hypothetical protein
VRGLRVSYLTGIRCHEGVTSFFDPLEINARA